jgi:hypothetical protein
LQEEFVQLVFYDFNVGPNVNCENIPNIEISLRKAYSETIFWRKGIRSLVVSLPQTSL